MGDLIMFPKVSRPRSGLVEAVRWMEERIGTSLDAVMAGDPEAIKTMERNMMKETMKARIAKEDDCLGRTEI